MKPQLRTIFNPVTVFSLAATLAFAGGGLEIPWHTIDGGGTMQSTGGSLVLSGTIGQHDAGPAGGAMTGGGFELTGGFWPAFLPSCACLGDMTGDGLKNGADIQKFVNCFIAGGSCACADMDGMNGITIDDVDEFVTDLLSGSACP